MKVKDLKKILETFDDELQVSTVESLSVYMLIKNPTVSVWRADTEGFFVQMNMDEPEADIFDPVVVIR